MKLPALHAILSEHDFRRDVLAGAGPIAKGSTWWSTDSALVCLAEVGPVGQKTSGRSYFSSARRFTWVAPAGAPFVAQDAYPLVPRQIRAKENGGRSLHLFVQSGPWEVTYLGETTPSYAYGGLRSGPAHADLELRHVVPSSLLARCGALRLDDRDHQAIDDRLVSLRSRSPDERLAVLRALVEEWHGPLAPSDGFSAEELAEIPMPDVLRQWLLLGGRRSFCIQNLLLGPMRPNQLRLVDGKLVFYVENQGVWEMATLAEGDDPPFWSKENDHRASWVQQDGSLSMALVEACLYESTMQGMYGGAIESAPAEVLALLERNLDELPYRWTAMGGLNARFFARGGALAVVLSTRHDAWEGASVLVGAQTEHPLAFLHDTDQRIWELAAF